MMNLTGTSGIAERYPRWSPDGRTLAYWSDRSGEYQLTLRAADGSGAEQVVTSLGAGFRYAPYWSPDSTRVAFFDQAMRLRIVDVQKKTVAEIDQSPRHDGTRASSSPLHRLVRGLTLARVVAARPRQHESGGLRVRHEDGKQAPGDVGVFRRRDASLRPGRQVPASTRRTATSSGVQRLRQLVELPNSTQIVAVPLKADTPSPLAERNDVEKPEEAKKNDDKKDEGRETGKGRGTKDRQGRRRTRQGRQGRARRARTARTTRRSRRR